MAPKLERIAVYPGSFDPLTLGHLDVIKRAAALFDRLVVGVGEARGKAPLFSVEDRIGLIQEAAGKIENVGVESFADLAVDFARRMKACAIIRGLRSPSDYAYEMQMALMNRAMAPQIETIFIPTSPQYSHISSSLAKEIANHGGDLNLLVPAQVVRKLAAKIKS